MLRQFSDSLKFRGDEGNCSSSYLRPRRDCERDFCSLAVWSRRARSRPIGIGAK